MKRSFASFNLKDLANKCDSMKDVDSMDLTITPFASRVSSNDDLLAMTITQPLKLFKISDIEFNNIPYYSNSGDTLVDAFSRSLSICNMESDTIRENGSRRIVSCKQKTVKRYVPDKSYEGHFTIISSKS